MSDTEEPDRVRLKVDVVIPEPLMLRIDAESDRWGASRPETIRRALFAYLLPNGLPTNQPAP
jgi:hypothetical protein